MLNAKKLGLAGGILWGLCIFIFTILALYIGYGMSWMISLKDIYPGYDVSLGGSILGAIYGFIDGYVSLFLLAWLYNKLLKS